MLACICLPAASRAEQSQVDRQAFPRGYSILTSEHLMYPVDVKDWPIRIDARRQLFVDDFLIASMTNLRREYHQPVKHPKNPLVVADRPWEGSQLCVETVRRDPVTGKFRMWYCEAKDREMYAESDDGLRWHKPELGLIAHQGSKRNNIVIDNGYMIGMIETPGAADPAKRYTAMVSHDEPIVPRSGYYIYHSPDGLSWKGALDWPVLIGSNNQRLYNSIGIGDTSIFRYASGAHWLEAGRTGADLQPRRASLEPAGRAQAVHPLGFGGQLGSGLLGPRPCGSVDGRR